MLMVPSTRGFVGAGAPLSTLDPNWCSTGTTLSNNNLTATGPTAGSGSTYGGSVIGTKGANSGKLYFEVTINSIGTSSTFSLGVFMGVVSTYFTRTGGTALNLEEYPGGDSYSSGIGQYEGVIIAEMNAGSQGYSSSIGAASGVVLMMAIDFTMGGGARGPGGGAWTWAGVNGTWVENQPGPTPDASISYSPLWPCLFVITNPQQGQMTFNPGPNFAYAIPSGFAAWGAGDGTGPFVSTSPGSSG